MKLHYKILTGLGIVTLPLILLLVVLIYQRLNGFKDALEELVRKKTDGKYILTIQKSSPEILNLSFRFEGLMILRSPTVPAKGIRSVNIPMLEVHFGSIRPMLAVKQVDVESLTIEEPVIEVDAAPRKKDPHQNVDFTQELIKLYPAIESLLAKFNIQSLIVKRASLGISRDSRQTFRFNAIDFLVHNWNIEHLTDSSQLQLKIAGQSVSLGKAVFNFSKMEFNFQQHFLQFKDFQFSSDTLAESRIRIAGSAVTLRRLNYSEFYNHQRYIIQKAEIDNPSITGHIKLKPRNPGKPRDKYVFTTVLKQVFGQCAIDTTQISNARVQITIEKNKGDSVHIQLPRLDMQGIGFNVIQDSSRFLLGGLDINLHQSAIALRNDLTLRFDGIHFDSDRDLTISDVVVYDSVLKKMVANFKAIQVKHFEFFHFIYEKEIRAHSMTMEDGNIQLTAKRLASFQKKAVSPIHQRVFIKDVSLKNINLDYADKNNAFSLAGLTVMVRNVKRDAQEQLSYEFKGLQFRMATIQLPSQHLEAVGRSIRFDGKEIDIGSLDLTKDSISVKFKMMHAEREGSTDFTKEYRQWKSLSIGDVQISGSISSKRVHPIQDSTGGNDFRLGDTRIETMGVTIQNKKVALHFSGSNMGIQSIESSADRLTYESIQGDLSNILIHAANWKAKAAGIRLDYPTRINVRHAEVVTNDFTSRVQSLELRSIGLHENRWTVEKSTASLLVIEGNDTPVLRSDSLWITSVAFEPDKVHSIQKVEIFHPVIHIPEKGIAKTSARTRPGNIPWPGILEIQPGELSLPGKNSITFGKIIRNHDQGTLTCPTVHFNSGNFDFTVSGISLHHDELRMDSLRLKNEAWFKTNTSESDLIRASLYNLKLVGTSADSLLAGKELKIHSVDVGGFKLDVSRDKRMPDPPEEDKPFLLDQLVPIAPSWKTETITLRQGKIRYAEISDKTGEEGVVSLDNINGDVSFRPGEQGRRMRLKATARIYEQGLIDLNYETMNTSSFHLAIQVTSLDLTRLNAAVLPLEAMRVKSGYLNQFTLDEVADQVSADGTATISYKNLHLILFKKGEPDHKTLGTELVTLLADGVILKNGKTNASASVNQIRFKDKSIFNYWIKSAVHGAMGAVRKGKTEKKPRN